MPAVYFTKCRECGVRIDLRHRKDAESFSNREVIDHYKKAHPAVWATYTFGMPYHVIEREVA